MAIKSLLKSTFIYGIFKKYQKAEADQNILIEWERYGKQVPPPHTYKVATIKEYRKKFKTKILFETGTYMGDTLEACQPYFKKLLSIELDKRLFENAKSKFAKNNNVELYHGDSGKLLKEILIGINEPCLFWLDGHYSEGITAKGDLITPILSELKYIFNHPIKNHVILIDDARAFVGEYDYPQIEVLKELVKKNSHYQNFFIESDIIRIY